MAEFTLRNDMRVGALGFTGCGKTQMFEIHLEQQPRVIVVDNKHRVNFEGFHLTSNPVAALLEPRTIYRPVGPVPDSFWLDAMFKLHEEGGGIIYIDEMSEVCSPSAMPPGLKTIFRMGRELGVVVWWSAQSSTEVTNTALRQSNILCLFLNQGASDRDKIIKTAGDIGEATQSLDFYEFLVFEAENKMYDPSHLPVYRVPAELVKK